MDTRPYYEPRVNGVERVPTAYLLGETPAQRETVCPGKPLEGEGEATAQKAQPADGTPPTYTDPEKARALIDEFKRSLVPSSLRP